MTKNDTRIMNLKADIQKRKETLTLSPVTFRPETNCMLKLDGKNFNLHTCDEEKLLSLAIDLNCKLISAASLPAPFIPETDPKKIMVNGFSIKAWMNDIYNLMQSEKYEKELRKLNGLERELSTLLSEDVKTGLRLDEIEKLF